jgi:hypothetical protein
MAAAKHNLIIDQGSDFNMRLTFRQNGVNMDLTGYNIRAQIRQSKTAPAITTSFTGLVVDALNGIFMISLPATTSSAINPGNYFYDVEVYGASVTRVLEGKVTITPEVTR